MFSKKIGSVLVLGAVAVLTAPSAMAATTVNGTILADNGSVAVHQQGNTFTVIPTSVAGNWPRPKDFSVDLPDDPESLRQCKIHVVAWGDGAVLQGAMAHFSGTAGFTYTGQANSPLNNVAMSSVTHPGGTAAGQTFANNSANAQAIVAGAPNANPAAFVSQAVVTGGVPGIWGPINLRAAMQERAKVKFVWNEKVTSLNVNPNNYRVLTMPCSTVVKPVPVVVTAQPHVASWEIAGQFNAAQNPYEVWTYGYTVDPNCNGPVIPYKIKGSNYFADRTFDHWLRNTLGDPNDHPTVSQSKGNTLLSPMKLSPNGLVVQPGTQNQCSVVRFTAPAAGNYRLMGRFWAQDVQSAGTDTNVMVSVNSMVSGSSATTLVPSTNIKSFGTVTNKPFMSTGVALEAGGTIDFKVGSNGNYINDAVGLHGYIQRDEP
jgi:hypothetical protein